MLSRIGKNGVRSSREHQTCNWRAVEALVHPFVVGELALAGLQKNRSSVLTFLQNQPKAQIVADSMVLHLIGKYMLYGQGIGYIDAHLLASANACDLDMDRDKKLQAASGRLGGESFSAMPGTTVDRRGEGQSLVPVFQRNPKPYLRSISSCALVLPSCWK
ncbi:MAG TPA: hypothetical protein VF861_11460 [Telluria sp.]